MIELLIFLGLLALGYFVGRNQELRHYKSIQIRERASTRMELYTGKTLPPNISVATAQLVTGHTVISIDYFKRFLANLRNIFGGRIRSYESILDRGRREAILRMKKEAREAGAQMIVNVRLETSQIASTQGKQGLGAIEILAYGTALKLNRSTKT